MMELLLSRENLLRALKRVEKNKGGHGVDEMPASNLRRHLMTHWADIRQALEAGTYRPMPVRRIEIPKPNGGVRKLGIPTVTDRFIQQALLQVLTPVFDPGFSPYSYGFRPGKRAHDAVRQARKYIEEGYRWVVDIDLEKFFDRVNHDKLMALVAKKVADKRILRLIRSYLQAGIMENGVVSPSQEGTPQGGPLSPLLSNILLDEWDKELEKRGHRFARYADDCQIFVKTKKAGHRVQESMIRFLEKKLRLKVNRGKSAVDRPWKRSFLGFSFTPHRHPRIRIAKESVRRMKDQIRRRTARSRSISMDQRIRELNRYLMGWCGYFALAETPTVFQRLDEWLRRRLRMIRWKEWKQPKNRVRQLLSLGIPKRKAHEWGNTRKKYWRIANSPILHKTLDLAYWQDQGLLSVVRRYRFLRQT